MALTPNEKCELVYGALSSLNAFERICILRKQSFEQERVLREYLENSNSELDLIGTSTLNKMGEYIRECEATISKLYFMAVEFGTGEAWETQEEFNKMLEDVRAKSKEVSGV